MYVGGKEKENKRLNTILRLRERERAKRPSETECNLAEEETGQEKLSQATKLTGQAQSQQSWASEPGGELRNMLYFDQNKWSK